VNLAMNVSGWSVPSHPARDVVKLGVRMSLIGSCTDITSTYGSPFLVSDGDVVLPGGECADR